MVSFLDDLAASPPMTWMGIDGLPVRSRMMRMLSLVSR